MKRKLVDALDALVDTGLIMTKEESTIYEMKFPRIAYDFNRSDIDHIQQDVATGLVYFFALAKKYKLPTHNAVAFFTKLAELEQKSTHSKSELREILHLALSGNGFVFGTTFDSEHSPYLRPCDLYAASEVGQNIETSALWNHASLKGGLYFREDYRIIEREIKKLAHQTQLVATWQREIETTHDEQTEDPQFKTDDLEAFWNIFEWYSMEQLNVSGVPPYEKNPVVKRVKNELVQIKTVSAFLLDLDHRICELEHLLKITDKDERLKVKREWVNNFFTFLLRGSTDVAIKLAETLGMGNNILPSLGLADFISTARKQTQSKQTDLRQTALKYPILQSDDCPVRLTRDEKKALTNYRKHPFFCSYRAIIKGLSDRRNTNIVPYYLTEWFIHKLNPLSPFIKQHSNVTISINDKITMSEDPRVHHYQKCNYLFFCRLCDWYADIEGRSYNEELCQALYARCRHQVVKKDWVLVESRTFSDRRSGEEPIFKLYQQLDGIFDYEAFPFPLYAKTLNHSESVLYYFYERQDDKLRKVQRKIKNVITNDDVNFYCTHVFCSDDGVGKSVMPLAWHRKLAEWLENIIRRDDVILDFVVGKEDPNYPGTAMPLSEIQDGIEFLNDKDKIYPEDIQPYLAFVQWYIHMVCCKRIRDSMHLQVLRLCKRVFLAQ